MVTQQPTTTTPAVPHTREEADPALAPAPLAVDDHEFFVMSDAHEPDRRLRSTSLFRDVFRLPASHDPAPESRRMVAMCAWAAVLAFVGLAIAGRVFVAVLAGGLPSWFEPTIFASGLTGIAFTVGAFLSIHRAYLPWALLTTATLPLVANLYFAVTTL